VKIKVFLMVLVLVVMMLVVTYPVFAGGGQVTGDKGEGSTHENFVNECEDQPCFDVAPRPQNGSK
jgi:hypothetical protein